jgi:hypothetical protein
MTLVATTYTDADGGYTFADVPPGDYTVVVTPPTGMDPTFDEDGIGTANETDITVVSGEEYDTADFGYNWVPPADSTTPDQNDPGAIGDSLWVDVDGNGVQDPGEPGLGGVDVKLYSDPDGDGIYDNLVATTTTAPDGSYIFDNLAPDAYVVVVNDGTTPTGYTQTGDPDGTLDNQTDPIVLAPGDVYVNADFGYEPNAGTTGSIGDTVWLDADLDNTIRTGRWTTRPIRSCWPPVTCTSTPTLATSRMPARRAASATRSGWMPIWTTRRMPGNRASRA